VTLYSAASLTPEQRLKLGAGDEGSAVATTTVPQQPLLFASVVAAAKPSPALQVAQRLGLTPEAERLATERLALLQPLLDWTGDPQSRFRFSQLTLQSGQSVTTSSMLAQYIVETNRSKHKLSVSTLWNWKRRYETQGLAGLARNLRADKGQSRFFAQNPAAAKLVASTYLRPYATADSAYNALIREAALLNLSLDELPSYSTVRRFLESIPAPVAVLAREGERQYKERMSQYLSRSYEDIAPGQIYVSDHMIHDVIIRNDCFVGVADGAPMRLRFTCIMDMRSRKIVGYSWTPEGNSRSIGTALRMALGRYGACEIFYCDNGKDYQKVAKGAHLATRTAVSEWIDEEMRALDRIGLLRRAGIVVQHCLPYHPQAKNIER
ncbi:MAG: transposase, partial [Acidobacteriota bacterium]|nr:transposase [Acidobacteriota bacterium]